MNAFVEKRIARCADSIVIIDNCLSRDEQQRLVDIVEEHGQLFGDNGQPSFSKNRGRVYSNLDAYGEDVKRYMKEICARTMADVRSVDPTIPGTDPTHLLTLCYVNKNGIGWHKDDGENDGDFDTPVISFTIGNSCVFEYRINDEVFSNTLRAGDVIVFGGPQRMVSHRVKKVLKDTVPEYLKMDNFRINLTFREAKSVFGKEDNFSTDNYIISKKVVKKRPPRRKRLSRKSEKMICSR